MLTVSPATGTPEGLQLPATLQLPSPGTQLRVSARAGVAPTVIMNSAAMHWDIHKARRILSPSNFDGTFVKTTGPVVQGRGGSPDRRPRHPDSQVHSAFLGNQLPFVGTNKQKKEKNFASRFSVCTRCDSHRAGSRWKISSSRGLAPKRRAKSLES